MAPFCPLGTKDGGYILVIMNVEIDGAVPPVAFQFVWEALAEWPFWLRLALCGLPGCDGMFPP